MLVDVSRMTNFKTSKKVIIPKKQRHVLAIWEYRYLYTDVFEIDLKPVFFRHNLMHCVAACCKKRRSRKIN